MYTGFRIDRPNGNNLFAYNQTHHSIYVAPIQYGTVYDLQVGTLPVFREFNSQKEIITYQGLSYFIETQYKTTPTVGNISSSTKGDTKQNNIIIFDNHNHALFFWYKAYKKTLFKKKIKLIHIDQHTDMNENKNTLGDIDNLNEQEIFYFTNYKCNVGNFIKPALQSGLIGSVELITTEHKLNHFNTDKKILQQEDYILDIDLDFRHPDMSIEDIEKTFTQARKLIQYAKYITIATSPYFLEQTLAINLCKSILK